MLDILNTQNHRTPKVHLTVRPNPKYAENGGEKDISQLISDRFNSLTLTDSRGFEADQLDLTLDDSDGLLVLPSRGAILSLAFGWADEPLIYKGEYTVDELEHSGAPDVVTIRARAADLRGSLMNRYERSFDKKTIGEIVAQIAGENQLKPQVSEVYKNTVIAHIDQTNESSINLLTRLAEQYDAIATVKNGNLLFIEAGGGKTASGKPLPVIQLTRQSGDSHRFAIAEGDNYTAVKAYWHNADTGKRGEVTWDNNSELKKVTKPSMRKVTKVRRDENGEIIKGADGKSIKDTVMVKGKGKGKTVNQIVQKEPVESDTDKIKTLRHTYATEQSAIKACKREFDRLSRGVASFSLTLAHGNAELIPEQPVEVKGFKPQIDSSSWIITQVTHAISGSGFTTTIECELQTTEAEAEK